jgi:hypothetical protein
LKLLFNGKLDFDVTESLSWNKNVPLKKYLCSLKNQLIDIFTGDLSCNEIFAYNKLRQIASFLDFCSKPES